MGYRILYDNDNMQIAAIATKKSGTRIIAVLLILTLMVGGLKLIGWDRLKYYLLPGDPDVTQAAFCSMMENIKTGATVKDAVTAFCVEIIENAR